MTLTARDFIATLLVVLIGIPYVGYLVNGEMPFVEDARGMSAIGLVLGAVAYAVLAQGDPSDRADRLEDVLALATFVLGFTAFALGETAAAEVLLAAFMGAVVLTWAVKLMDHAGVLPTTHPTRA